jgi:hypothetical protein
MDYNNGIVLDFNLSYKAPITKGHLSNKTPLTEGFTSLIRPLPLKTLYTSMDYNNGGLSTEKGMVYILVWIIIMVVCLQRREW